MPLSRTVTKSLAFAHPHPRTNHLLCASKQWEISTGRKIQRERVGYTCNPSTQEAEAGPRFPGQPELYSEVLSQEQTTSPKQRTLPCIAASGAGLGLSWSRAHSLPIMYLPAYVILGQTWSARVPDSPLRALETRAHSQFVPHTGCTVLGG